MVRRPGKSLVNGITTAGLGQPDYHLACQQHERYIEMLHNCGLEITVLDTEEAFPDSVFIEDTAVLTPEFAVVCRPQPASRSGETESVSIRLGDFYSETHAIQDPGTIEGGDVMQIEDSFYIGISDRTNEAGADQFIRIIQDYGYKGFKIAFGDLLHLKTGISYLGENTVLTCTELAAESCFHRFEKILVNTSETYAANCIRVNETVIFPSGFPETRDMLTRRGFRVLETDMSEFRKLDGGLSCLSLRFFR